MYDVDLMYSVTGTRNLSGWYGEYGQEIKRWWRQYRDTEDNTEMIRDNTAPGSSTIDKIYIVYFSIRFKGAQWSLITTVHLGDLDI